jgi:hypothetical protein
MSDVTLAATALALASLCLGACGDDADPFADLVRVSGDSPFTPACNEGQSGRSFRNSEVEPFVAVDPTDPLHLIGVWQQDRWSNGGASGNLTAVSFDGGETWSIGSAAFSGCTGGDYERATDPWVTITPEGVAFQIALAFDATSSRNAILVSRSDDGGRAWGAPVTLIEDTDPDVFNDKCAITADPLDPTRVYAVWDRITGLLEPTMPIGTGPTLFARFTGTEWEPARAIYDPGLDAQTLGNVIVVLPDGTLVDVFNQIEGFSGDDATRRIGLIRSTDQGLTWSAPVFVAPLRPAGVVVDDVFLRSGTELVSIAVDPSSGALHLVWEEGSFSGGARDGIAMTTSLDGGLTWSAPRQIGQDREVPAFLPTVAVAPDGVIAVTYYDLGDDVIAWLLTSTDGGATFSERPLTGSFGLRHTRLGDFYFLGDYQGLVARTAGAGGFLPFFSVGGPSDDDPTNIYVPRPAPTD